MHILKGQKKNMICLTTLSTHLTITYRRTYNERKNTLLFPIASGSSVCTIPQTVQHIPQPLLHQLCSTGWNEKQFNRSTRFPSNATVCVNTYPIKVKSRCPGHIYQVSRLPSKTLSSFC